MRTKRITPSMSAIVMALAFVSGPVSAANNAINPDTLSRLMHAKPSKEVVRLSPVREAALEASARAIGTQTGLIEHAKEIAKEIAARRVEMERTFRFGDLVIGPGVLPPVLVHTENAATVTDDSMRLAGAVYKIKQPARFFSGAPSWRDWLLMGLPTEDDLPEMPTNEQLLPRDNQERAFWQQKVSEAYVSGRQQAREIFEHNLSTLEQVYGGMRTFYDLYQRNMVSAPVIAKSQEIVTQDDPNTIVVGDTLFRITMPAQFQTNPELWRALQAKPSTKPLLPIGHGFDPEQVRHAFAVYQQQLIERQQAQKGKHTNKPESKPTAAQSKPTAPRRATPSRPTAQAMPVQAVAPVVATPVKLSEKPVVASAKPASTPEPAKAVPAASAINPATPLFAVPTR